jgi:hypothetical protein
MRGGFVDGARTGTDRSVHAGSLRTGRKPGQTARSTQPQVWVSFRVRLWRLGTEWSVPVFAICTSFGRR